MRRILVALPLLTIATYAAPALAQDDGPQFNGPHIGVTAGQGSAKDRTDVNSVQLGTNRDGDYSENVNTAVGANTFTPTNDGDMVWGWQAGAGAEFKAGGNLSLGVEYLYNRYDDNKYLVAVGQGTAAADNPFLLNGGGTNMRQDPRFAFDTLRATVNLRF